MSLCLCTISSPLPGLVANVVVSDRSAVVVLTTFSIGEGFVVIVAFGITGDDIPGM